MPAYSVNGNHVLPLESVSAIAPVPSFATDAMIRSAPVVSIASVVVMTPDPVEALIVLTM